MVFYMFFLLVCHSVRFSCHCSPHLTLVAAFRSPLLLDVAATEDGRAHVITDGLAGIEQEMIPLLGFLAKSQREAEFPIAILMRPGRHGVHLESAGRRRFFFFKRLNLFIMWRSHFFLLVSTVHISHVSCMSRDLNVLNAMLYPVIPVA